MTVYPEIYGLIRRIFRTDADRGPPTARAVEVYVRAPGQAAPTLDELFDLILVLNATPRTGRPPATPLPPMITKRQYDRLPAGLKGLFVPKRMTV